MTVFDENTIKIEYIAFKEEGDYSMKLVIEAKDSDKNKIMEAVKSLLKIASKVTIELSAEFGDETEYLKKDRVLMSRIKNSELNKKKNPTKEFTLKEFDSHTKNFIKINNKKNKV